MELLIDFFDSQNHKGTINKMHNLLGAQRKREEYLNGGRHYKPRVEE